MKRAKDLVKGDIIRINTLDSLYQCGYVVVKDVYPTSKDKIRVFWEHNLNPYIPFAKEYNKTLERDQKIEVISMSEYFIILEKAYQKKELAEQEKEKEELQSNGLTVGELKKMLAEAADSNIVMWSEEQRHIEKGDLYFANPEP